MTPNSALYVGSVMHRRLRPKLHRFRYRAFWCLLDLDELPNLSRRLFLFSYNRANVFSLRDTDHGDGSTMPLRRQIEQLLAEAGIELADGSIRLLCMPRTLGYCFNPLSVYFCHGPSGALLARIYQVHNTFGERHSYVIPTVLDHGSHRQRCDKNFYVSPFLDMKLRYDFRVAGPDEHVCIGISATSAGSPILSAVLTGQRRKLTDLNLIRLAANMPLVTLKVMTAIHWEALRLWLKGLRPIRRPLSPTPQTMTVADKKPTLEGTHVA